MASDKKFVYTIYRQLFEENFERYKFYLNKPADSGSDAYAKARNALASLDEAKRADVIDFLKVVIADSAAGILATLDGVSFPGNLDGEFVLSYNDEAIQGDLADIFIEKGQDDGVYG